MSGPASSSGSCWAGLPACAPVLKQPHRTVSLPIGRRTPSTRREAMVALVDVLGRVGIWTRQLDEQHGTVAEKAVAELESLGYRSVWIPEAVHREVISHAT